MPTRNPTYFWCCRTTDAESCISRFTTHPTAEWTAHQLREAFPLDKAPRCLLRDRDRIFGRDFVEQVKAIGIKQALAVGPYCPFRKSGKGPSSIGQKASGNRGLNDVVAAGVMNLNAFFCSAVSGGVKGYGLAPLNGSARFTSKTLMSKTKGCPKGNRFRRIEAMAS
jgi:hypothetical protein